MHKLGQIFKGLDWLILAPATFIFCIGTLVQYAILFKTRGIDIEFSLITQIVALVLGVASVIGLAFFTTGTWRKYAKWAYLVSLILLVIVAFAGSHAYGSERWIAIGSWQLQPTEIAKVSVVLFLAHVLDVKKARLNRFVSIVRSLVVVVVPAVLVLLQPDLGSALVFVALWLAMLFNSRLQLSRFIGLIIILLGLTVIAVPFLAEYQQERLVSYFNPDKDVAGANYNVIQAGIAIGSGGVLGAGLDSGSQSQLNFLPSQHTDFIFAVTSEKLGLIGAVSVIFSFILLYIRMLYVAWRSNNQYERLVLVGVVAFLFFHTLVNIGMNLGLMPVTGVPLPLLSYGGTFLYITVVVIGMTMIISYRQHKSDLKNR